MEGTIVFIHENQDHEVPSKNQYLPADRPDHPAGDGLAGNSLRGGGYRLPGGISARDEQLINATAGFILGMAGWLVVWRREVFVKDLGVTVRGRWAVFWGFVTVALFWGAGVWFLVQAFN